MQLFGFFEKILFWQDTRTNFGSFNFYEIHFPAVWKIGLKLDRLSNTSLHGLPQFDVKMVRVAHLDDTMARIFKIKDDIQRQTYQ
jgi:hypothetical protein